MRDVMWICVLLLCSSEAWSGNPVCRNLTSNLGSEVNLTCSKSTWNKTIYVIWNMKLKKKNCTISSDLIYDQRVNNCTDGWSLRNRSGSQPYLHIPNFTRDDVGTYRCELVYSGGREDHAINLTVTVAPHTRAWLEAQNNKTVAVCKAERGNPAANISWSHAGNTPLYQALPHSDGFVTVESRLELPEDADPTNLSCFVSHPSWDQVQTVTVTEAEKARLPWLFMVIVVLAVVVLLVGSFALKRLITWRRAQQPDLSSSKLPEEYVEEVEPYASYVQRVNSIYNSSADLFT